jgi:hypothetical protein
MPYVYISSEYRKLREENPTHYNHFWHMVDRSKYNNTECEFTKDFDGLIKFIKAIGPVPSMKRPTVGRYNHSKGYIFDHQMNRWNFRWEEHSDNVSEMLQRQLSNGTHISQTGKSGWYTNSLSQKSEAGKLGSKSTNSQGRSGFQQRAKCLDHQKEGPLAIMKRWHKKCTLQTL